MNSLMEPLDPEPFQAIAIDWSGAKHPRGHLWSALADAAGLRELVPLDSREHAVERLLEHLVAFPNCVAGLDFGFSFPAWYLAELGVAQAADLWTTVKQHGEGWLARCEPPFWGRPGKPKPTLPEHYRRAELLVGETTGAHPKSVFQIGGAGAVGTGSLRGMPFLPQFRAAGVAVWPFDPPRRPMVMEIYPRLFTGKVVKSSRSAREEYLQRHAPGWSDRHLTLTADCEDAFDAAISAVGLRASLSKRSVPSGDSTSHLEGEIWPIVEHLSMGRSTQTQ